MQLHLQNDYACTVETFWQMYWDSEFDHLISHDSDVQRELIDEREHNGVQIRRLRFTPHRELPRPVAKLLGSTRLVYEQENAWDRASGTVHFKVLPKVLPDKVTAEGSFRVAPTPQGCRQTIDAEISVRVRFIGSRIEQAIVDEITTSYERMRFAARTWLAAHG